MFLNSNKLLIQCSFALFLLVNHFQVNAQLDYNVLSTKVEFLGKSRPISELESQASSSIAHKAKYKINKKKPDNFKNRRGFSKVNRPELEHQGVDPVLQKMTRAPFRTIDAIVNIDGIGDFGSPHDPSGDIGREFYVQAINATFVGIFDKTGTQIQEFAMNTLWNEFGVQSEGDPIVLYDEEVNRWLITEFTDPANVLIAISENSDPRGSYFAYNFSTPEFPDYPKYAIYPEAYVLTTNEGGAGVLHNYFIDRVAMLNGEDNVTMQRVEVVGNNNTEAGFFVSTPVDWNGDLTPTDIRPITMALNDASWGAVDQDQVELYLFDIDWNNPDSTKVENQSIVTAPFDGFPCSNLNGGAFACVPQPNGGGLDAVPEVIMNIPHYRNFGTHESIVFSFVTDVTDGDNLSGIRWMEIRKKTANSIWKLEQEGTWAPDDGLDRYMSSIAIDKDGNMGLGYNCSSENEFVGVRFTGRLLEDPQGEMSFQEVEAVKGLATIQSGARFGDYSQMSVDPEDETTFWFTTEYAGDGQNVTKTRIVSFRLAKDTFDLSLKSFLNPNSSSTLTANEPVSVRVFNSGLNSIPSYSVRFSFKGNFVEEFIVSDTLMPDSSLDITFINSVDLSTVETYDFEFEVITSRDDNLNNNILRSQIQKYYSNDASLNLQQINPSCESNVEQVFEILNNGTDTITQFELEVSVDSAKIDTLSWEGELAFEELITLNFPLLDLAEGDHIVVGNLISINGGNDQRLENNSFENSIRILGNEGQVDLTLVPDQFPEEINWSILNQAGVELYNETLEYGSDTLKQALCLQKDTCYTVIITDGYGDGFCCYSGDGSFSLDFNGETILFTLGDIGSEYTSEFCVKVGCNLSAQIDIVQVSSPDQNDGSILINAMSANGELTYSIDGGINFSAEALFENLEVGEYMIVVQSGDSSCVYSETIEIGINTSTLNLNNSDASLIVKPNPNDGYFQVELTNMNSNQNFINLELYNQVGQLMLSKRMQNYSDTFITPVSLVAYPAGNYYLKVFNEEISFISKVLIE